MNRLKTISLFFEQKSRIDEDIQTILKKIAQEICPYKKGDIVEIDGYKHDGKKSRVESIYMTIASDNGTIKLGYRGTVLKKDGSDSNFHVNVSSSTDHVLKTCLNNFIKRDTGIDVSKKYSPSLKDAVK